MQFIHFQFCNMLAERPACYCRLEIIIKTVNPEGEFCDSVQVLSGAGDLQLFHTPRLACMDIKVNNLCGFNPRTKHTIMFHTMFIGVFSHHLL